MVRLLSLFALLSVLILVACDLDVPPPQFVSNTPVNPYADREITGAIELNNLAVGQGRRYIFFKTSGFPTHTNEQLGYGTDTLVQKVVAENDNGFLIGEYLTEGSFSKQNFIGNVADPDSIFRYYYHVENDTLYVLPTDQVQLRSNFFGFAIGEFPRFRLDQVSTPDVTESWDGEFCSDCEKTVGIEEWTVNGRSFSDLNAHLDTRLLQVDQLGLLKIYNGVDGFVRSGFHRNDTNEGIGWDVID